MTPISLLDDVSLLSFSVADDSLCLQTSFTWWGVPLTSTVWGLITPHQPVFCKIWWCIGSPVAWPRQVPQLGIWFGVYAFHALLILVYAICWRARWHFVIFGCCIIPLHGLHYQAMQTWGYSLDSVVTLLCNAVTFWDISTLVSYLYAPFISESEESLAIKSWGIIRQYFSTPHLKKTDFSSHMMADASRCVSWHPTVKYQAAIGQLQESIATVMGYVHTKPIPVVSLFDFSLFPPSRTWVAWLAFLTSLYYWSDYSFHGRGACHTAEIGHASDARMSTLSIYGLDFFRC